MSGAAANISRPRPVSMLGRPTRRSTGSAPEQIQRSLSVAVRTMNIGDSPETATQQEQQQPQPHPRHSSLKTAPRKISTVSLPAAIGSPLSATIDGDDGGVFFAGDNGQVPHQPLQPTRSRPGSSKKDSSPLSSSPSSPLQNAPPCNGFAPNHHQHHNATSSTTAAAAAAVVVGGGMEQTLFGDRYAALANLHQQQNWQQQNGDISGINWEGGESAQENQSAEKSPTSPSERRNSQPGLQSKGSNHGKSGGAAGATKARNCDQGGNRRPSLVVAASEDSGQMNGITASWAPPQPEPITGDRYSALVNLTSACTETAIDWGSSQLDSEEADVNIKQGQNATSPKDMAGGNGQPQHLKNGYVAGATSASPPKSKMAAQANTLQQSGYHHGARFFNGQPAVYNAAANSPGYIPTMGPYAPQSHNGYCLPHGGQSVNPFTTAVPTVAGFSSQHQAYPPAMSAPQGFANPAPAGLMWQQAPGGSNAVVGYNASHFPASSSATPLAAGSSQLSQRFPGQVPLCRS